MADARHRVVTRLNGREVRREKGQILILFTMAIIVIMLFASIVIDLGVLRNNRQILVNAVDAAALAGGTKMPVNGCTVKNQVSTANCPSVDNAEVNAALNLVITTLAGTYPGISTTGWSMVAHVPPDGGADYTLSTAAYTVQISFRCLIGVTSANPPLPYVSRDVPIVCNPRMALGHTPVATDFKGAGPTRYSLCRPDLGDKCNVVVVNGVTTTPYTFGRVVGVNSGSSGAVASAACNGPCGQPPAAPVDLVVIIDRTSSMSATQVANARAAAKAVLGVYDPALQRVAIGFLGPSETSTTCSGTGGPAVSVNTFTGNNPVPSIENTTNGATAAATGSTSINVARPGSLSNGDLLVAAITVNTNIVTSGTGTRLNAPLGWTLINRQVNGTAITLATYYKVITNAGGELANYTWTFTNQAGTAVTWRATGAIVHLNNADTADPIDQFGGGFGPTVGGNNTAGAPDITTAASTELLAFVSNSNAGGSGGYFNNWTNSMSEVLDIRGNNAATPSLGVAQDQPGAGPSGITAVELDGAGSFAGQHVSINPVPGDTYGWTYPTDLSKWIPIGFTGTDTDSPAQAYNEVYSDANGTVFNNTHIVSAINCFDFPGGTSTNLTVPMQMAAKYLQQYGRQDVKWGILFETDGEPNFSGYGIQATQYTCKSFVDAATAAKAITNGNGQHIEVFTVGFLDPGSDPNCPDGTGSYPSSSYNGDNISLMLADAASTNLTPSPNGSANGCVAAENSDQDHFFCQPNDTELSTVFKTIATTFAGVRTHLVQLDPLPIIYSLSPTTGPGTTLITITGKYFTGVTSVKYAGGNVAFTFLSDTSIRINAPAGAPGVADIIVTTPAGSSPIHGGAKFTRT